MGKLVLHVHSIPDAAEARFAAIEGRLVTLEAQMGAVMTTQQTFDTLLGEMRTATDDIAAELARLRQAILDKTIDDAGMASFDALVRRLKSMGTDATNPTSAPAAGV